VTDKATDARTRRPAFLPTVLVALACFGVTFEFLALQLQAGRDPALKASPTSAIPAKVRPRRKVIITTVFPAATGGRSRTTSSTGGSFSAPAPVTSSTS